MYTSQLELDLHVFLPVELHPLFDICLEEVDKRGYLIIKFWLSCLSLPLHPVVFGQMVEMTKCPNAVQERDGELFAVANTGRKKRQTQQRLAIVLPLGGSTRKSRLDDSEGKVLCQSGFFGKQTCQKFLVDFRMGFLNEVAASKSKMILSTVCQECFTFGNCQK